MARTSVIAGLVMLLIGRVGYIAAQTNSVTAMIPDLFGLVFIILGVLATSAKENIRLQAMIGAAVIGAGGCIMAAIVGVGGLISLIRGSEGESALAVGMQLAMSVACAIYVIACIRWFGRRSSNGTTSLSPTAE